MNPEIDHTLAPSPSARLTLEQKLQILGDDMDHEEQVNQVLDILCKHISNPEDVYNLVKDLYHNAEAERRFCDIIEDVWELIK